MAIPLPMHAMNWRAGSEALDRQNAVVTPMRPSTCVARLKPHQARTVR